MSLFLRIDGSDVWDAVQEFWEGKGYVFVYPNLLPPQPGWALFLVEWTTSYELRKMTAVYTRAEAGVPPQDDAMTTHHFLNITGGVPDATWTDTDYAAVETAFTTFWTAITDRFTNIVTLSELNWRADGPAFKPFGSSLQPTLRATARSVAGAATGSACPPQVAISVTERTDARFTVTDVEGVGTQSRNRWGRFYLPQPAVSALVTDGRIANAAATDIADSAETFYEACVTAGLIPVMYSPTTGHAWSVTQLAVDDLADVIRSRRHRTATNYHVRDITQV